MSALHARGSAPIVVTGPMRSGTSCVTGLLEQAGFDLGRAIAVHRAPSGFNRRGHFELPLLGKINARLIEDAGGDGLRALPSQAALAQVAPRHESALRFFVDRFDGEVLKDPMLCLTWPLWKNRWPEPPTVVYCLRDPRAVAASAERRYGISRPGAVRYWTAYTRRLLEAADEAHVVVFDFDAFCRDRVRPLVGLTHRLGRPLAHDDAQRVAEDFFLTPKSMAPRATAGTELPDEVGQLLRELRDRSTAPPREEKEPAACS